MGVRQRPQQRRLPGVGRADQDPLARSLAPHVPGINAMARAALAVLALLLELGEAAPEICLKLLGALVLGQERHHLAQRLELLVVRRGLAEALLRVLVLGREIRRHCRLII